MGRGQGGNECPVRETRGIIVSPTGVAGREGVVLAGCMASVWEEGGGRKPCECLGVRQGSGVKRWEIERYESKPAQFSSSWRKNSACEVYSPSSLQ